MRSGVDFTNVLLAAIAHTDLNSAKRQASHQCLFVLLGSGRKKVDSKMLVKLTPDYVNERVTQMSANTIRKDELSHEIGFNNELAKMIPFNLGFVKSSKKASM